MWAINCCCRLPALQYGCAASTRRTAQSEIGLTGQRCALNLAGTDFDKQDVRRGDWVVAEPAHGPTQRLDVRLHLLAGADKPLRHWSPVHFHLGAVDVMARVALLEHEVLQPGETGLAQIVLDRTIGALRGDRFIIRDQSASRTIGGGRVLDPFPPERKRRTPERLAVLAALERPAVHAVLQGMLEATPAGIDLHRFALSCNLSPEQAGSVAPGCGYGRGRRHCLRDAGLGILAAVCAGTAGGGARLSPETSRAECKQLAHDGGTAPGSASLSPACWRHCGTKGASCKAGPGCICRSIASRFHPATRRSGKGWRRCCWISRSSRPGCAIWPIH